MSAYWRGYCDYMLSLQDGKLYENPYEETQEKLDWVRGMTRAVLETTIDKDRNQPA